LCREGEGGVVIFLKIYPKRGSRNIVSPEGRATDPEKLRVIREWPTAKNKHEIRSFLDLCTYYRRFISCFVNIVKPLTKLTKEKQTFQWTPEVEAAFQTPKEGAV
jgi:hypothetical protein